MTSKKKINSIPFLAYIGTQQLLDESVYLVFWLGAGSLGSSTRAVLNLFSTAAHLMGVEHLSPQDGPVSDLLRTQLDIFDTY